MCFIYFYIYFLTIQCIYTLSTFTLSTYFFNTHKFLWKCNISPLHTILLYTLHISIHILNISLHMSYISLHSLNISSLITMLLFIFLCTHIFLYTYDIIMIILIHITYFFNKSSPSIRLLSTGVVCSIELFYVLQKRGR